MTLFHMLLSSYGSRLTRCPDGKVVLVKRVNPRASPLISSANRLVSIPIYCYSRFMADYE